MLKARIALIGHQLLLHEAAFPLREPFRVLGEIGNAEKQNGRENASDDALEDENPVSRRISAHAVHLADGAGEQASEGGGKTRGAGEEGESLLDLGAGVPHADQVVTYNPVVRNQQMKVP